MAWLLCRSVLSCQRRRAGAAAAAAPLPALLVLALLLVAPLIAWRAATALAQDLVPVLADAPSAMLLSLAPAIAGVTVGAALALTAGRRASLGPQVATLPIGSRTAIAALVLAPAGVAGVLLALAPKRLDLRRRLLQVVVEPADAGGGSLLFDGAMLRGHGVQIG